jgi:hypothetical protein
MGADVQFMPPIGIIASNQARQMFAEACLQQFYINKESLHIPCNGVDISQLLVAFPTLRNVSMYHTAMQLTAPPSLGFHTGT